MSSLHCIVYVSTATVPMSTPQLESLLVEARELNLRSRVTGVLLYSDGDFMQYFEGDEEALHATYARIRNSRRHRGLIELLKEPIPTRRFQGWQMGFLQPTSSAMLSLSTARWRGEDVMGNLGQAESAGMALLRDFWRRRPHEF